MTTIIIIYINSAPSIRDTSTTVQLYADDMKCYRVTDNDAGAFQLQRDTIKFLKIVGRLGLSWNSTLLSVSTLSLQRKKIVHASHNLNGSQTEVTSTEKDLGVHVSSNLSWIDHIDLILSKANTMLGSISRTCTNECDQKPLFILCKSLASPQLEYASQVWFPCTK